VGQVEQPGTAANRPVFGQFAAVFERHLPPREIGELGAQRPMFFQQRRFRDSCGIAKSV
jgi:hypothetical protein